ncbi:MAG TPA: adenylate/guanylate cyclase domain-containing protein [Methylomirabilota bacterium]|nr:adenylate/guanylate cyclase domain-containing protein [Methylomirabilota bacterium]
MSAPGRRHYRELTCALAALLAVTAAAWARPPVAADGPLLDLLVGARAALTRSERAVEDAAVAVIALDPESLAAPELAPYPRAFLAPAWATVLDGVLAAGARAVGFDLLLAYSANRFTPDFDRPFLAALDRHRARVVLARSATTLPAPPFLAALGHDPAALGLAELPADPDGRHRHVRAGYDVAGTGPLPSLAAALLQRAGAAPMPTHVLVAPRRHLEALPTYALIDVLRCAADAPATLARAFGGKAVLVGTTLPEEDRRVSSSRFLPSPRRDGPPLAPCGLRRLAASDPDSASVPAVFLHAAAVDAVLAGRVTREAPPAAVTGLTALTAILGAATGLALAPWLAVAATAGLAALLLGAAMGALMADLWIPVALPLAALGAAPALAYVVRYLVEERARRRIQHAFGRYLAPAIVDRLAADPAALRLGGERREVTVMFADLAGFTALSGRVEPETLTRLTNRYLGLLVSEVEATGGYVDKFIGDAVMALWGVPADDPRHAQNGIRAAIAAARRVRDECLAAEARGEPGFAVHIGLNSGPAIVGNVGTDRRYNYTAVGETVNIAARLEKVPDAYACAVVVGPRTAELARDEFLLRELDAIHLKGLAVPLPIFEPVAEQARATVEQRGQVRLFGEALAHYRTLRFADAYAAWDALARAERGIDKDEPPPGPAARMAERARVLAANPPGRPWDGGWPPTAAGARRPE